MDRKMTKSRTATAARVRSRQPRTPTPPTDPVVQSLINNPKHAAGRDAYTRAMRTLTKEDRVLVMGFIESILSAPPLTAPHAADTDARLSRKPYIPTLEARLRLVQHLVTLIHIGVAIDNEQIGVDRDTILEAVEPQAARVYEELYWIELALIQAGLMNTPAPTDDERQDGEDALTNGGRR
jgi:hypothetical protein